jgi:NtrC-family two-component system sensor histidine kinase KinB
MNDNSEPNLAAAFNEINQAIDVSVTLDELLDNILNKLKRLFSFTSGAISLWNPKTEQLVIRGCIGPVVRLDEVVPLDEGYASWLVQEREPLLREGTQEQTPGFQSYVGVPLLSGAKLVGTLELFSDRMGAFSMAALDVLQAVGNYVAVAIEGARMQRETLLRAEEMAIMNSLSAAVSASLNLDELLEIIVYSVCQAIGCDRSAVFLMDNERGVLSLAKSQGLSEDFVRQNQNIRPDLEGKGQVVLDRYPLVVSDLRRWESPAQFASLLGQERILAFVDLPLRGREHVLGALTVYYDHPHIFEESELELLRSIANQVTLALENARLYERTDRALARRVSQLAAIEEIGRELTSTLDITRVFNLVLQRAMGTTGASAGYLAVCDPDCDELELIVDSGYPPGTLERYWTDGFPTTDGIVRQVARTGKTSLANDVRTAPNYVAYLPDTSAQLVVPIVKDAGVLGVVALESSRSEGFSPDDVRFTTQLAELAAIAIDNARLFEQVREGRDNLQAILDSTQEAVLVIGRDNRVVLANPKIEEMSSLSAQVLVGRRVSTLVAESGSQVATLLGCPDNDAEQVFDLLDATSDQVTKRIYELPGPPSRHIEQATTPVIDKDGTVVGRLIVFRDVSEERRLALMRQDLTDMIIHDLRSPLTAVIGGVQVANDLLESSADTSVIHHALDMANQSCNHLMSLVDSLLDISRLEAGQMPLEPHPILLPQLTLSVIQQMRPIAERESVTLELLATPTTPPVYADYELVNRVLVNLVDNALKHSPRNTAVIIEIAPEFLNEAQHLTDPAGGEATPSAYSAMVRCTVSDAGPGIPNEFRLRVFERFAQLDGRRRGKGLGLAFCRLAVQAHGGRIWVEDNADGKGSAFSFTLPVVPPEIFPPEGFDLGRRLIQDESSFR